MLCLRLALAFGLLLVSSTALFGEDVNIGLITFDVLVPAGVGPGVNVFNISNLTGDPSVGGFALPPDFPVLTNLIFLGGTLTLTGSGAPLVIPLGDLAPGPIPDTSSIQFPDTTSFTSAAFAATLSQISFGLADGRTFTAGSPNIIATILPSSGPSLVPGSDFVVVTVSDAPEPCSVALLGMALLSLIAVARARTV